MNVYVDFLPLLDGSVENWSKNPNNIIYVSPTVLPDRINYVRCDSLARLLLVIDRVDYGVIPDESGVFKLLELNNFEYAIVDNMIHFSKFSLDNG